MPISSTRKCTVLLLLLCLSLVTSSCLNSNSSSGPSLDVVETAQTYSAFDTFVQKAQDTGLDSILSGAGPYTLFIPTDEAFSDLPATLMDTLTNEQLKAILSYHIVEDVIYTNNLEAQQAIETLEGEDIYVQAGTDSININNNANMIAGNLQATNGIIHAIDQVVLPDIYLDVVGIFTKQYDLNSFTNAVSDAALTDTLKKNTAEGYTVFAPSNTAFDEITLPNNQQDLKDLLLYHVLPKEMLPDDFQGSQTVETLNGETLTIEKNNGSLTINGETAITTPALKGTNGVVYVIDQTLEPSSN